ncbi:MAG: methyltransferase [Candidatus Devosia phytovorans]|uniref:Methyltransferase n=1 Tax=Candidatus Devosia phytovorans TaxID=3121372 RepID=A0AAJ6AYS9_9HYPH|nr:methyltransferase [Devosia sp.]WEK03036.1 MAG: methyltransferase [Devosia sp.]
MLGAAVGEGRKTLLDMGCGVGTAALVALAHNADVTGTLADRNAEMLALARVNADENGLASQVQIIEADVTARHADRLAGGMLDNGYDVIIANPPFFTDGAGTPAGDAGRAGSRHMQAEALDVWIKTAASAAAAGGEIIFVFPSENLTALLAGFEQRFGAVTVLPLSPRPGQPANRVLIRGIKGSRAPLTLLASRVLHGEGRSFAPEFDAIFRGTARLVW